MNESVCGDHSLLQSLAEGTLDGSDLPMVKSHVAVCPDCRRAVTEYKLMMWDLAHPPEVPIPPELERSHLALMQEWKQEQQSPTPVRQGSRSFVPAWAGYSVSWTRNLPAVHRMGSLLVRTGSAVIGRSLARWMRPKGGGHD